MFLRINLYLDKPDAPESFIVIYISLNGFRLRVSSGVKINPKHCKLRGKRKIEKLISNYPSYRANQSEIDKICNYITDYVIENNTKNQLREPELKNAIDAFKKPAKSAKSVNEQNILDLVNLFIEKRKNNDLFEATHTRPFSERAIKNYISTYNHLEEFYASTKYMNTIEAFQTDRFWENLRSYLNKKDLHANTVAGHCKVLKVFGRWAIKENLMPSYDFSIWKARKEETPLFALDDAELRVLSDINLNHYPKLRNVRDVFLLQCYTGLRYSDLCRLKTEDFDLENGEIHVKTQKTEASVTIPIIPPLRELLLEYQDIPFHFISLQKYNSYLKQIGEMAELNGKAKLIRYEQGKAVETPYRKAELLSSHCARRTFVTTALRLKIPQELIMKVTGHKTHSSFQKYIKLTNDDVKDAFMEAFNKQ